MIANLFYHFRIRSVSFLVCFGGRIECCRRFKLVVSENGFLGVVDQGDHCQHHHWMNQVNMISKREDQLYPHLSQGTQRHHFNFTYFTKTYSNF